MTVTVFGTTYKVTQVLENHFILENGMTVHKSLVTEDNEMKLPERVEQLLTNTENIDYLIEIVKGDKDTPAELEGFENELDYLYKYDENSIYEMWLEL